MKEVREEIDLLDKELVMLLARRQKCVEMAALVKNDKNQNRLQMMLINQYDKKSCIKSLFQRTRALFF